MSKESFAATEFFCWTDPRLTPVQAAELSIRNCGDKSVSTGSISQDFEKKEILCVHTVICEALTDEFKKYLSSSTGKELSKLTDSEIRTSIDGKFGNISVLNCRGTIEKVSGKAIPTCPKPNSCKDDLFYRFGPASMNPPKATQFRTNPTRSKEAVQ